MADVSSSGPVFVCCVGIPWAGDLDFGPRFASRAAALPWPRDVVVEAAALAAHRLLHRLQELRPRHVVVVASHPRGDPPGTVRRFSLADLPESEDADVHARLGESASGVIDVDHALVVNRYFGTLPETTTVIEVEPAELAFGDRLSPAVESRFDEVLELVRRETV